MTTARSSTPTDRFVRRDYPRRRRARGCLCCRSRWPRPHASQEYSRWPQRPAAHRRLQDLPDSTHPSTSTSRCYIATDRQDCLLVRLRHTLSRRRATDCRFHRSRWPRPSEDREYCLPQAGPSFHTHRASACCKNLSRNQGRNQGSYRHECLCCIGWSHVPERFDRCAVEETRAVAE